MSFIDDIFADGLLADIITDIGADAVLSKTAKTYLPESGEEMVDSASSTPITVTPPEAFSTYEVSRSNGSILTSDFKTLLSPFGLVVVPEVGDLLTLGTILFRVKAIQPIYSGNAVAAYVIQLRK